MVPVCPVLTSVTAAYLPRNLRPVVLSITVHPPGAVFQKPFSTGELEIAGFDDNTSDGRNQSQSKDAAASVGALASPTPALGRKVDQKGLQTFVWKADDENDDRLEYNIFYRREGETTWKPLKQGLWDPIFVWDTTSVPDGTYYVKVKAATALGARTVRFDLAGDHDREMPHILGLMPILPRHAVDAERFEETSLAPPLGSGPYVVAEVDAGRSVTLRRNPAYWGRDLAVNRGMWNFDIMRLDFYRDANGQFEAFKKGLCDAREEMDPGRWEAGYDFPAARDGRVVAGPVRRTDDLIATLRVRADAIRALAATPSSHQHFLRMLPASFWRVGRGDR